MGTPKIREERVEWRVETDQTEDDFGADEQAARRWQTICQHDPNWEPVVLMRRTVVTETSPWEAI